MPRKLLVSVVLPVYNRLPLVQRALESIKLQTYRPLELIVVDDGSEEDIEALISAFKRDADFDVHYIRQSNFGTGVARNVGLAHAHGDFIQYLDSDDVLLPAKIEAQVMRMQAEPAVVMCYTPSWCERDGGRQLRLFSNLPADDLLATALQWRRWGTSACLWRYPERSIADWGSYRRGGDLFHDVGIGVQYRTISFIAEPMVIIDQRSAFRSPYPILSSDPLAVKELNDTIAEVHRKCLELLQQHALSQVAKYAEPLSERFLYLGYWFAMRDDLKKSGWAFARSIALTRSPLKRLEALLGISAIYVTAGKARGVYRILWRAHRRLVPPEVHCYRGIG